MNKVKALYFSCKSDRKLVEMHFNGKSFSSISEIEKLADNVGVCFSGHENITTFASLLNAECEICDDWICFAIVEGKEVDVCLQ